MHRKPKIRDRKLGRHKADGLFWAEDKLIEVDPRQSSRDRLDTVIHEAVHMADLRCNRGRGFSIPHEDVEKISETISDVLWADRWRRIEE